MSEGELRAQIDPNLLPAHALNASHHAEALEHAGHSTLHRQLVWMILALMFASQMGLVYWRRSHPRSFRRVTLLGAWLAVPLLAIATRAFWLLLSLWLVYTLLAARLVARALRVPLDKHTPRDVYTFFLAVFRLSQGVAGVGYVILCIEFMMPAFIPLIGMVAWLALQLIGVGLYFGLLCRDTAELCCDAMSASLGYGTFVAKGKRARGKGDDDDDAAAADLPRRALQSNVCGICSLPLANLRDASGGAAVADDATDEPVVELNCKHRYHEACVRGWTLVGKKDVCPQCGEKVAYGESITVHPWQRTSVLWAQCLDAIGLLVVWNPLIILSLQAVIYVFDR
jgi:RING finger protein 121/175